MMSLSSCSLLSVSSAWMARNCTSRSASPPGKRIRLVLAHYLGVHIDLFQRIGLSPASASVIQLPSNGTVRVLRINDDGPLKAPQHKVEKDEGRGDAEDSAGSARESRPEADEG